MVTERDPAEFARLSQLGDILSLGPLDISSVHSEFAERAYNESVKQVRGSCPGSRRGSSPLHPKKVLLHHIIVSCRGRGLQAQRVMFKLED